MPAIARLDDVSTGHGPFPPTKMFVTPVTKTYFNGKLAGVKDAQCKFIVHNSGPVVHPAETRYPSQGASKTYIEGKLAVRIGDMLADGDAISQGSPNTFIE
jgi:uncharacterized Zn-binding protein involved in type VI secretion